MADYLTRFPGGVGRGLGQQRRITRPAATGLFVRLRRVSQQYLREGPVPLRLVAVSFLAAVGSAGWGLSRNREGFIDNLLVEITVIGIGVVTTNIVLAGIQRGRQLEKAHGLLDHLARDAVFIGREVLDAVGLAQGYASTPVATFNGSQDVSKAVDRHVSLLALYQQQVEEVAIHSEPASQGSTITRELLHSVQAKIDSLAEVTIPNLQALTIDPALQARAEDLKSEFTTWKGNALANLRMLDGGGSIQLPVTLQITARLLAALRGLLEEAKQVVA
jgi:hypothetical protein